MSDFNNNPDLEELIAKNNENSTLAGKIKYHSKYFVVDGTSSAAVSSLMVISEYITRMNWEEIQRSRSKGAILAFLTGYFYNLGREQAQKLVSSNSTKKGVVDAALGITIGMATAAPGYAFTLYLADIPVQERIIPLVAGSAAASVLGVLYNYVADRWREVWGLQPVLKR